MYDVTSANVDVRVVMGSTRAKSPSADLARDIGLMNAGIYDKTQVIMNMQADVDKAGLIQRMGETSQLMAENQQLKQQLQNLSGDLQTRERELFHTKMRAEVAEATKPVQEGCKQSPSNCKSGTTKTTGTYKANCRRFKFLITTTYKLGNRSPRSIKGNFKKLGA